MPSGEGTGGSGGRVRQASESDVAALVFLNAAVQDHHARLYPDHFKASPDSKEVAEFFLRIINAREHSLGIFEGAQGALGYIWLEEIERPQSVFTNSSRRLHIHHLSVKAGARGSGAGTALLGWAERLARASGILQVTAEHWAANGAAHDFFRRRGFEELRIIMGRQISAR